MHARLLLGHRTFSARVEKNGDVFFYHNCCVIRKFYVSLHHIFSAMEETNTNETNKIYVKKKEDYRYEDLYKVQGIHLAGEYHL